MVANAPLLAIIRISVNFPWVEILGVIVEAIYVVEIVHVAGDEKSEMDMLSSGSLVPFGLFRFGA